MTIECDMIYIVNEDGTALRLTGQVWLPDSVVARVEPTEWGQFIYTKGGKKYWVPGDAARVLIEEATATADTVAEYEDDLSFRDNEYNKEIMDE